MLLNGVDADMLTDTGDYFRKLLGNLDRMIEQAGSSTRQRTQDRPRSVLERVACDLGRTRRQTAWHCGGGILEARSLPVMGSVVPTSRR